MAEDKKSILVIEDDKFLRELIIGKLLLEGFSVESATDAKEAYGHLNKKVPSLIILDLILPDTHGFEVLEKIRSEERWKHAEVIVLSNLDQEEDMERARKLGVKDFMIKSNFSLSEIVARVKRVLDM